MSAVEDVAEVVEETIDLVEEGSRWVCELSPRQHIIQYAIVGAISGVAVGFLARYLTQREMQGKYEQILQEQIAEAKAFYALANKEGDYSTPEKAVKHLRPLPDPQVEEAVEALNQYQGKEEVTEEERSVNIFVEHRPEDDNFNLEEEMNSRTPDEPYVIHQNEFLEAEPGYDQITITYYEGDGTLADDSDQEIPYVDPIVGQGNLQRFGHGSGDDRIVYIRNERMSTDFEVIRSDGKYAHEVLGFEHSDGGERARRLRNQPRKFRGEDE